MKIEVIDNNNYKIYINNLYTKGFDETDKEELGKYVKSIILKIKKIYDVLLEGLYEVHVYVIKFIGVVLEIKNIDSYFSKTIDLKIIVHNNEKAFLKVFRYELVENYHQLKYLNNCFYLDVNDLLEGDIYKLVENSQIVYGNDLKDLKSKWTSLTI